MTTVVTQDHAEEDPAALRAERALLADEAEQAVETIEAKIAGMKKSLTTAKAEAKRLRAEVGKD